MQRQVVPSDRNTASESSKRHAVQPEERNGTITTSIHAFLRVLNGEPLSLGPDGRVVAEEDVTRFGIDVLLPGECSARFWRSEIGQKETRRRVDEFRDANDGIFPNVLELKAMGLGVAYNVSPRVSGGFFIWLGYSRQELNASRTTKSNRLFESAPQEEVERYGIDVETPKWFLRSQRGWDEMRRRVDAFLDANGRLPHNDKELKEIGVYGLDKVARERSVSIFELLGYPKELIETRKQELSDARKQIIANNPYFSTERTPGPASTVPEDQKAAEGASVRVNPDDITVAELLRSSSSDVWRKEEVMDEAARRYAALVEKHGRQPAPSELKGDPVLSGVLSAYTRDGLTASDLRYALRAR